MNSLIVFLLDHSGSMHYSWPATQAGFNTFLKYQQMRMDEACFFKAEFDTTYKITHDFVSVFEAAPMEGDFGNGDMTALYDSIRHTVELVEARIRSLPKAEQPVNVTFVIQSDGADNRSRSLNITDTAALISSHADWQWVMLASEHSAAQEARALGIRDIIQYSNGTPEETITTFETIGQKILESVVTGDWRRAS